MSRLGGYAYCAIAALSFLDRAPSSPYLPSESKTAMSEGIADRQGLLGFLAHRQFEYLSRQEESDEEEENFLQSELGSLSLEDGCKHVGFNGRWNKKADTCYCWWVGGTLHVSGFACVIVHQHGQNCLQTLTNATCKLAAPRCTFTIQRPTIPQLYPRYNPARYRRFFQGRRWSARHLPLVPRLSGALNDGRY